MPLSCVVPNCETKKLKKNEKIYMFRVPKNDDMREKWRKSIRLPTLRSSQRVCEKHFNENSIIREYIKHDKDGKIIAQVPLKHVRLEVGAVPTIFAQSVSKNRSLQMINCESEIVLSDHTYALRTEVIQMDCLNTSYDCENSRALQSCGLNVSSEEELNVTSEGLTTETLTMENNYMIENNVEMDTFNEEELQIASPDMTVEMLTVQNNCNENNIGNILCTASVCTELNSQSCSAENKTQNMSYMISPGSDSKTGDTVQEDAQAQLISKANTSFQSNFKTSAESSNARSIFINSSSLHNVFTFQFDTQCSEILEDFVEIEIPKPWSFSISLIGEEQALIFTYIIENNNYERKRHIFEKTVIIKYSRQIIYEVYSTSVDVVGTKLPQVLNDFRKIPEILKNFKDMFICKGIIDTIPITSNSKVSKTCTGTDLRHKNCTLLSFNSARCRACKTYYTSFVKSLKRTKERKSVQRIATFTNPIDQLKARAMRRKMKMRTKQCKRLKQKFMKTFHVI